MKQYATEQRKAFDTEYVKVFLLDEKRNAEVQEALSKLDCVKKVNLNPSKSVNNPKESLTVYPKKMIDAQTLDKQIINFLNNYFNGIVDNSLPVKNTAHFNGILDRLLKTLDNAQVSILLAMSWFTNDILLEKLIQKQNSGIDVKVIVYDDGINKTHGVDLTKLNAVHKVKGTRCGIMHNKFCVVDNQVVVTGSYNWTTNAETRNDENIVVQFDPKTATDYSVIFNQLFKQ